MSTFTRSAGALAVAALFAGAMSFAQSTGAAVYKARCQSCHGAEGVPNPGIAKIMGVKPASDPAVKADSRARMIALTTDGKGKMPAFKNKLSQEQIKDAVDYFRGFMK